MPSTEPSTYDMLKYWLNKCLKLVTPTFGFKTCLCLVIAPLTQLWFYFFYMTVSSESFPFIFLVSSPHCGTGVVLNIACLLKE